MHTQGQPYSFLNILLLLLFSSGQCYTSGTPQAHLFVKEKFILLQVSSEWGNPPALQDWNNTTSISYCSWTAINCTDGSVTAITLPYQVVDRPIPESICKLKNLTHLDLNFNNIPGTFPVTLYNCSNLQYLDLSRNLFVGIIPSDLHKLSSQLTYLDLSGNNFSSSIPPSIGLLPAIKTLNLYNNLFDGTFPIEFSKLVTLETLALAYNPFLQSIIPPEFGKLINLKFLWMTQMNLIGKIPETLGNLSALVQLDLGSNSLHGTIPASIGSLEKLQYLYLFNNILTGKIPETLGNLSVLEYLDLSYNNLSSTKPQSMSKLNLSYVNLSYNNLSGEIPMQIFNELTFEKNFEGNPGLCPPRNLKFNLPSQCQSSNPKRSPNKLLVLFIMLSGFAVLIIVVAFLLSSSHYRKRAETNDTESWKFISFTKWNFNEIEIEQGLISSNTIGSGGSGEVYKITLGNGAGPTIAVKKIFNDKRSDTKLENQFEAEVKILSSIRHSNIVQLLCCIASTKSKLVVYEFVENGNLKEWIKGKKMRTESGELLWLDWPKRLKIAIHAAEGLCYMHHHCAEPIVHRDLKSSNILLDKDFGAKIADFGLAKMLDKDGEPKTVSCLADTFGYIAPECAYSRKVNEKMDVYSFGVVLLELTTGRTPNDCDGLCIADWALQTFFQDETLMSAMDQNISDNPVFIDEIKEMLKLGIHCTARSPLQRPSMKVVVQWLKQIQGTTRGVNILTENSVPDADSYIR